MNPRGFTMLDIVVAIVLLTIGALGYALVSANLMRASYMDARRSRAGELIESQREILLRQGCALAASGAASRFGLPLEWTVGSAGGTTRTISLMATRPGFAAPHTDSLRAVIPCT